MAWRDENGRRDAQRYNLFSVAQLRYRAVRAQITHQLILDQDAYEDSELREDEAATMFDAAAQLIAKHLNATVNIPEEEELANFVDWALDVVGHQFFQDVPPKS